MKFSLAEILNFLGTLAAIVVGFVFSYLLWGVLNTYLDKLQYDKMVSKYESYNKELEYEMRKIYLEDLKKERR